MTACSGQERIRQAFQQAQAEQRCALMPYLMLGYPNMTSSMLAVTAAVAAGADMLELGLPFSDPIADGPAIQSAGLWCAAAGYDDRSMSWGASRLRSEGMGVPFLFMGYYNPIFVRGPAAFAASCCAAGVDGLIVPDLPPEEAGDLAMACREEGLALIFLVAPNTPDARLAAIAAQAHGFLYLVSRPGTTGARSDLAAGLPEYVARVAATPACRWASASASRRPATCARLQAWSMASSSAALSLKSRSRGRKRWARF